MPNNQETAVNNSMDPPEKDKFKNIHTRHPQVKLSTGQRNQGNKRSANDVTASKKCVKIPNNQNLAKSRKAEKAAVEESLCEKLGSLQISKTNNNEPLTKRMIKRRNMKANKTKRLAIDKSSSFSNGVGKLEVRSIRRSSSEELSAAQDTGAGTASSVSLADDGNVSNDSLSKIDNEFKKIQKKFKKEGHCKLNIEHPWKDKFQNCSKYCIHKAAQFRQGTLKWLKNEVKKATNKSYSVRKIPAKLNTMSEEGHIKPFAVYRIIKFASGKYYLTPIHHEIFATDRADLRLVQLDDLAICRNNRTDFWMGSLFDGDLIGITAMSPTYKMPKNGLPEKNNDPNIVIQMDYKPLWRVDNFFILLRKYKENSLIWPYDIGNVSRDRISLAGFGLDRPIKMKKSFFPMKAVIGKLYTADLFIPKEKIDCFLADEGSIEPNDYYHLAKFASTLLFFSRPDVTPVNIRPPVPKYVEYLKAAPIAFKSYKNPLDVLKFGLRYASSTMATVSNDNFDYQVYHAPYEIVKKQHFRKGDENVKVIMNFKISKDTGPPSAILWKPPKKINLIIPQGSIRGNVHSSVLKNDHVVVTAKFTSENVDPYRKALLKPENRQKAIVEQVENPKDVILKNLMISADNMKLTSNGYLLISALFGGKKIEQSEDEIGNIRRVRLIDRPSYYLDEHQSRYVDLAGKMYPGIVANSPFGCGKTTTMAVTQLELCEKMPERIHLTLGMTNSSVVNLVEAAARLKPDEMDANILRLISLRNRHDLEKNSHTDYDIPIIRDQVLTKFVLNMDKESITKSMCPSEKRISDFKLALAYFITFDLIKRDELCSSFGRTTYDNVKKCTSDYNFDKIDSMFFKLYKPKRISSTVSTMLADSWMFFRDKVATIQIDEASQLPYTAFFALVKTFPNACFTLVGDYHQLPPYCDPLAAGKAQAIGVGKLLKSAYSQKLIPSVTLHYVYRCHPEITRALGSSFYEYNLESNVMPIERMSKVKEQEWWKNKNYPFIFVQSSGRSDLCHTSLYNNREIDVVEKLLENMGKVIELKDIGIATFYKAQTNMLMKKYQESDVFVGTVDSFQGREKEVVIVCLTSNSSKPSGFLLDKQRINVALSRARRAVIIIGNHKLLVNSPWASVLASIQKNGNIVEDRVFFQNERPKRPPLKPSKQKRVPNRTMLLRYSEKQMKSKKC